MIMPVGQRLLLPANPAFIWGSLVLAFFLNMFFNMVFSVARPGRRICWPSC